MADWLVYWKTYWEKLADPSEVTANWNSSYDPLYQKAGPGDVIWVVVSGGPGNENEWRLLECFTVRTKKTNDTAAEHRYRFVGDGDSHEVFDPSPPSDLTPILTSLDFASDRPIRYSGRKIGQALQTPRKLAAHDARTLSVYAKHLPRISRGIAWTG
jgi:hypothetical protein